MGKDNYGKYLLLNAKTGNRGAYMQLVEFYYEKIFQLSFQIHSDLLHAKNNTVETFAKAWKSLSKVNDDTDPLFWFQKIAAIVSFYHIKYDEIESHLKDEEKQKHVHHNPFPLSNMETIFTKLPNISKITIVLHDKLDMSCDKITESLGEKDNEKIITQYYLAMLKLTQTPEYKLLPQLDQDSWIKLNRAFHKNETIAILPSSDKNAKLKDELIHFKNEAKSLFKNINPPDSIIAEIKSKLMEDSQARQARIDLRNTSRKERRYLEEKQKLHERMYATIESSSLHDSLHLIPEEKIVPKRRRRKLVPIVSILIFIVLIIFTYFYFFGTKSNTPWHLSAFEGQYTVNGANGITDFYETDQLYVLKNSSVTIKIPETGELIADANTSIRLEQGENSKNIIFFDFGQVEYRSDKPISDSKSISSQPNLIITTKFGELLTNESDFSFINRPDSSEISAIDGWLELKSYGGFSIYLGPNYRYNPSRPNSIPVHRDTDSKIINYCNNSSLSKFSISQILDSSKEYDLITLWHIFENSLPTEKQMVFEKLTEYLPSLKDEIKNDLLKLNYDDITYIVENIKWDLLTQ